MPVVYPPFWQSPSPTARPAPLPAHTGFTLRLHLFNTAALQGSGGALGAAEGVQAGRPDWEQIIEQIRRDSNGEVVAGLVCGPLSMTGSVSRLMRQAGIHVHNETLLL